MTRKVDISTNQINNPGSDSGISATEGLRGRVTLATLATHLGLSKTTVSVVISDSSAAKMIPVQTRQRILRAADELGYTPHHLARSLRKNRSMTIGVLAPEISEGYFTLVMNGVEEYLLKAGYYYFTASHYWSRKRLKEHTRLLLERAVDGLLLINTPSDETVTLPTVAISSHSQVPGVVNITLDHRRAALIALEHLASLGHRRVAFMRGQDFSLDAEDRWRFIVHSAEALGIEIDPGILIHLSRNIWSPELGYGPVRDLLERRRDFTAMFCFNDLAAIGAIRALHEAGLRVPQDVSVIGFDDVMAAKFGIPSLTTVRQPLAQMGRVAAKTLLDRIENPTGELPGEISMLPELITRESTGPVPVRVEGKRRSIKGVR